jgi:hypothetical protein
LSHQRHLDQPLASSASPAAVATGLLDAVRAGLPPAGCDWVDRALTAIGPPLDRDAFTAAYTAAARRVGKVTPALAGGEAGRAGEATWSRDEMMRGALLIMAAEVTAPETLQSLVDDLYHHGDNRERQAVLRVLPLLPEPERFIPLAVEACRTSIQPLFEAIACENPYPAAHFPEPNFNQMILKALFIGVPLRRIVGLPERVTGELKRMAADYASERRAAGRSVSVDIGDVLDETGAAS